MKRNSIQFILLVTILLTTNMYNSQGLSVSTEVVSISYEKTDYAMDLDYAMGLGAEFQLVLHLLDTSKTAITFSYEVTTIVSIESNENINKTLILGQNSVNGSIEPGNSIRINHSVVKCTTGVTVPFYFEFIPVLNSTAKLSIDMIIYEYGEDTCGPQIGPGETVINLMILAFLLAIISAIIIASYRLITSRRST